MRRDVYEQLASILSTMPASAWPHHKLLATRFGQVDCTRPSACAAIEHNDSISLIQGICGNRHQHLYADSPGLCDESTYSFQKRHFCLFCQVQKLRAKHTDRKIWVEQGVINSDNVFGLLSHRYQAGEDMMELCDIADMPPCMFLRRLLEQPPWCFSEQVNMTYLSCLQGSYCRLCCAPTL